MPGMFPEIGMTVYYVDGSEQKVTIRMRALTETERKYGVTLKDLGDGRTEPTLFMVYMQLKFDKIVLPIFEKWLERVANYGIDSVEAPDLGDEL